MSRFQTARLVRSEKRKVKIGLIFKKWAIPASFYFIFLFSIQLTGSKCSI